VLLPFDNGPDFIAALFGCFYAGMIAVPACPPASRHGHERLISIARDAQIAIVAADSMAVDSFEEAFERSPALRQIGCISAEVSQSQSGH
jgi:acyl-CoA synthetase (AMP-forming)/AMP-acid ligase II